MSHQLIQQAAKKRLLRDCFYKRNEFVEVFSTRNPCLTLSPIPTKTLNPVSYHRGSTLLRLHGLETSLSDESRRKVVQTARTRQAASRHLQCALLSGGRSCLLFNPRRTGADKLMMVLCAMFLPLIRGDTFFSGKNNV